MSFLRLRFMRNKPDSNVEPLTSLDVNEKILPASALRGTPHSCRARIHAIDEHP
jgi:hypothetical protein